jgi:hypothetical protein
MQYISAVQAQKRLNQGLPVQPGNWVQDGRFIKGVFSRVVMELIKNGVKSYLRMHPTDSKKSVGKRYNITMKSAKKGEGVPSDPNSYHVAKQYMSEAKKSLEINRLSHIAYKANAGIKIIKAK